MRQEIEEYLEKIRNRKFHFPDEPLAITDEEFQAIADTALLVMKGKLSIFLITYLAIWVDMVIGYDIDFEDIELDDINFVDEDLTTPAEDKRN